MANRACAEIGWRAIRDFRARQVQERMADDLDVRYLATLGSPCKHSSYRKTTTLAKARIAPPATLLHSVLCCWARAGRYSISTAQPALQLVA
mgnify:CR=1 FL=1